MKQCCKDYLMEQFGDEEVIGEIYAEYVASIHEKTPEIDTALANEDWNSLDKLAHAVKGNALATGDKDIADAAIALRIAAKMSDKATAGSLIAKIKDFSKDL